ncbi:unnamed protein product [Schistosoma mattheei]|uniref:Uncharacterized protein n=1 Tax=Schistosoma mattheei TaxID=31246 RepID=A0A183PKX3_9TREM|nr:unnamed protein product [Schistosoma mattheei]
MGSVVIEERAISRLLQHLKIDDYSGPDDIHLKIVEALLDVSEESLAILLDMSLKQSKLPRKENTTISSVYKAGGLKT